MFVDHISYYLKELKTNSFNFSKVINPETYVHVSLRNTRMAFE